MSNIGWSIIFLSISVFTSTLFIWGTFGFNIKWIKKSFDRIFQRWEKWEIVEENVSTAHKRYTEGVWITTHTTYHDLMKRRNKYTGMYKYRKIKRK